MSAAIETVFFFVDLKPTGGKLQLVQFVNGIIAILRGGLPVKGCRWKARYLSKAVNEFQRVKVGLEAGAATSDCARRRSGRR